MNYNKSVFFFVTASVASSGSGGSSPENSNYLRVSAAFGQRRLSDNVLTAPGHRRLSGRHVVIVVVDGVDVAVFGVKLFNITNKPVLISHSFVIPLLFAGVSFL